MSALSGAVNFELESFGVVCSPGYLGTGYSYLGTVRLPLNQHLCMSYVQQPCEKRPKHVAPFRQEMEQGMERDNGVGTNSA